MRNDIILMVDDNRILSKAVGRYLAQHGLRVINVATAAQARRAVTIHSPALLVIDMQLPDGTGLELVETWATRGLRIIAITADSAAHCERELLGLGATAYLIKPFPLPLLAEIISRTLDHQPGAAIDSHAR